MSHRNKDRKGVEVIPDSVPLTGTMYNQFFRANPEQSPVKPLP